MERRKPSIELSPEVKVRENVKRNASEPPRAGSTEYKVPPGQPSKYRPGYDVMVQKLRLMGGSYKTIADFFLVSEDTLVEWRKQFPEFDEAWRLAGDYADGLVSHALYRKALGYEHEAVKIFADTKTGEVIEVPYTQRHAPDTAAATFWLTNRQPHLWKNRQDTKLTGPNGEALIPPTIIIAGREPE